MKSLDANFQTHIQGTVQTVATLWKLTRADGVVMGFTDHQANIILGGVAYRATSGFTASNIVSSPPFAVYNF